jgi:hypothetical protein
MAPAGTGGQIVTPAEPWDVVRVPRRSAQAPAWRMDWWDVWQEHVGFPGRHPAVRRIVPRARADIAEGARQAADGCKPR